MKNLPRRPATSSRQTPLPRKLLAVLVAACYSAAQAGPLAPSVVAGQASFSQQGKTYTITNTPNTIINWQGFSLATDEIAKFVQQGADSRVLNRIAGQDPSVILGAIQSNGKVFLINPNGVLFGAGAQVDVNGLVASSLALSNSDFLAGKNNFNGSPDAGKVSNAGSIRTPAGGQVFLIAPSVENRGIISTENGQVVLAAGHSVQLFEAGDPNLQVVVSAAADQALNLGQIVAQGGRIGVYGALVNQRGRISADSAVRGANGKIVLKSSGSTLLEAGSSTTARGSNLNVGGDIMLLGPQVGLTGNAVVDASGAAGGGTVLLGGDYQGRNPAISNARQSYVGKDSVVRADALDTGNGGKVIVWSDDSTRMLGSISARGGSHGGDGGFVETSGHVLDMQGKVDTLAPLGKTGTLLLDPGNIYIALDNDIAIQGGMHESIYDYTSLSGSGPFAASNITADSFLSKQTLETALQGNNVTVTNSESMASGTGKIVLLSPLQWNSAQRLTLDASGNIELRAPVTASNGALTLNGSALTLQSALTLNGLTLHAGNGQTIASTAAVAVSGIFDLQSGNWLQNGSLPAFSAADFRLSGGSFVRVLSGDGSSGTPYALTDVYGLQGAATLSTSQWYTLSNDINASGTAGWNAGAGFKPIADRLHPYTGTFHGNDHVISGLTINRPDESHVGLFATLGNGRIRNLSLVGGSIHGQETVGAIVGDAAHPDGQLSHLASSATVDGINEVGGVVGYNAAALSDSSASGNVTGGSGSTARYIGGLAGRNSGTIEHSWASGAVSSTGEGYVGGLVGSNYGNGLYDASISRSYATGSVTSSGEIVGGLVGDNDGGEIATSYAAGNVNGGRNVGGLAGRSRIHGDEGGIIHDAYATGNVSGNLSRTDFVHGNIGGLLGEMVDGNVSQVYSTGTVTAANWQNVNAMLGYKGGGTLSAAYYNSSNAGNSVEGTPLTSAQMQHAENFAGFAFATNPLWRIYENHGTPLLKDLLTAITVTVTGGASVTKTYDGNSAALSGASASALPAGVAGTLGWDGAKNVGSYGVGGLYSTQYDITYTGANPQLVISPREVSATVSAQKVYNGSVGVDSESLTSTLNNVVAADTAVHVTGEVAFNNRSVGSGKALIVSGARLSGENAGNYTLVGPVTGTGTISPKPLALSDVSLIATREYNGTDLAGTIGSGATIAPGIAYDDVHLATQGTFTARFNNKNVGNNKPVTFTVSGYTLTGSDAGNYVVAGPSDLSANITQATVTINGLTAASRVYNLALDAGEYNNYGTLATINTGNAVLGNIFGSDAVELVSVRGSFNNRNVGTNKPVNAYSGVLTGADASNYRVAPGSFLDTLSASITPAPLTLTLQSREYNNSTAASFTNAVLNGVLTDGASREDVVTLVTGAATGSYADKNIGTAKAVTIGGGGLSLTGSDAGNYALSTVQGTITARPLSTWSGSGGGLWSAAGNWADNIAPDGANVLAATIGSSAGIITYDANSGSTTLNQLTVGSGSQLAVSGGTLTVGGTASLGGATLNLNGGSLVLNGATTVNNLTLASGVLSGTNSAATLTAYNLTQTNGSIDMSGSLNVYGYGNIAIGNVRAQNSITLSAGENGGSITQTGALTTNSLHVNATTGITLTNNGNHVGAFTADNSSSGSILFNNTVNSGELALGALTTHNGNIVIDNHGGIHTGGTVHAYNGGVSITAHSPITISDNLIGDDIALSASTNITLQGAAALNAVNSISMVATDNIVLGGLLSVSSPSGSISAVATNGNIIVGSATTINSNGARVVLAAPYGSVSASSVTLGSGTVPSIDSGTAALAAAEAAAKAIADANAAAAAAAKAAADAAAKAAADAAAKAAADAAAKAAADAAAKAAADAAVKAAADAAAKAAADAAAKAATDAAAAKAAADAAQAAADAASKAAADAANAAAKAAADAAAKAAADAAAKAVADAAAAAAANQTATPVAQALNSTVNIINTVTQAQSGILKAPPVTTPPDVATATTATGSSGGTSKPDDKVPDEKNKSSGKVDVLASKNEPTKKMYCN